MTIIVESGATKSDWRIINESGEQTDRFLLPGMNVSSMNMDVIKGVLSSGLEAIGNLDGSSLFLYTAGVVTDSIREELKKHFLTKAAFTELDIQNDLVGAARSVLGRKSGIVAIMGTGSNTCQYDGKTVSQKVMSGGFIIGDEGSGSALGKLFLSDFIKNLIPEDVAKDFASKFDATYAGIVENLYHGKSPSGYLGSLAPFILSHYENPAIKRLVEKNFQNFIDRSLSQYDTVEYPLGIVGGFGCACKDIFTPMCEKAGIKIAGYLPEPITGLIEYHLSQSDSIHME